MTAQLSDRRDMDFVLYEQLGVQELLEAEAYGDLNRQALDMVITEARNFALKELLPVRTPGEEAGVKFENGRVRVPECFHRPFRLFGRGDWIALADDPAMGGQGLPHVIAQAASDYLLGANPALTLYATMGHGTGKMIEHFGTDRQKKLYLAALYSGRWTGTMLLTEPQAGSDVGALSTTATPNEDGSWSICGNKIFITNGEHDLTENIIHPVLARIKGAPAGTPGLSLFLVPKIRVNDDGTLGQANDVVCTGVEKKMGAHASATCSLSLGSRGRCRGQLLGQAGQGMKIMFHMMNEARLFTGAMGLHAASAAYLYALDYAKSRLQGRAFEKMADPQAPQVPIIEHPDVRRNLLEMKAYVDGMRSLTYYTAFCFDQAKCAPASETRQTFQDRIGLLTPVVKAYCSDRGFDVCSRAMQVFGGYGYIRDYPVEQLLRSVKIAAIVEGTNGIQAMDLLGRKLGMKKGAVFAELIMQIRATAAEARADAALAQMADSVEKAAERLAALAGFMAETAFSADVKTAFAHAHPFLDVMGDVIMAWMLLWRASAASEKGKQTGKSEVFYQGQYLTAAYFIQTLLPQTMGRMDGIEACSNAPVQMPSEAFGS